jgi:hypothetical protein
MKGNDDAFMPSMNKEFRVLQLNVQKRRETLLSVLNDKSMRGVGALIILEPNCYLMNRQRLMVSPMHHPEWTPILPSTHNLEWPFVRSMLWIHRDLRATPIPIQSPDLTAVSLKMEGRLLLIIAAYIPRFSSSAPDSEAALKERLRLIRQAVDNIK